MRDEAYMELALSLAQKAAAGGEVPVGAVAVWEDGRIVGVGVNGRERDKNALAHAELAAISMACKTLGGWRLHKCTLYVTLEPCPMCAGAIINARIKRLVYGAPDAKAGCFGTLCNMNHMGFNHRVEVCGGVLEEKCSALLTDFFKKLRKKRVSS